jgi:hypothetical protein
VVNYHVSLTPTSFLKNDKVAQALMSFFFVLSGFMAMYTNASTDFILGHVVEHDFVFLLGIQFGKALSGRRSAMVEAGLPSEGAPGLGTLWNIDGPLRKETAGKNPSAHDEISPGHRPRCAWPGPHTSRVWLARLGSAFSSVCRGCRDPRDTPKTKASKGRCLLLLGGSATPARCTAA